MRKFFLCFVVSLFALFEIQGQTVLLPNDFSGHTNTITFLQTNYPSCISEVSGQYFLDTTCTALVTEDSLSLVNPGSSYVYDLRILKYFDNLRYLHLERIVIAEDLMIPVPSGSPDYLPENLEKLIYVNIEGAGLPLNRKLRFLDNQGWLASTQLPDSLRYFRFINSQSSSVPNLPAFLDTFICFGHRGIAPSTNLITQLPDLPQTLKYLDCGGNALANLPSLPDGLLYLDCSSQSSNLSPQDFQLNLGNLPPLPASLKYFNCAGNKITTLPPLPAGLTYLNIGGQRWFEDDLRFGGSPTVLHEGISVLSNLPSGLDTLICSGNKLTSLPPLPPGLKYLNCSNNVRPHASDPVSSGITSIGTSLPGDITHIYVGNTLLQCLPHIPATAIVVSTEGSRITCLPNSGSYTAIPALPLCSPTNNVNACRSSPVIAGIFYYDNNSNGVRDAGENPRANVEVQAGSGLSAYSNIHGYFELSGDTGVNTINIVAPAPYVSVPASASYNFSTFDTIVNDLYALQPTVLMDSLRVSIIANSPARPGFDMGYTIHYENVGTTVIGSNMQVTYDDANLVYMNASIPGVTSNAGVLTIPLINTSPADRGSFSIEFTVNTSAVLGDTLLSVVSASVNAGSVRDSVFNIITGAYDPNDKNATPVLTTAQVVDGAFINYLVRFQNTGTDTAFNVVITDQLESRLNASTFQMLEASHPAIVKRDGNALTFEFLNIQLPDSNVNEPLSHGYIKFRVKPVSTLVGGDVVNNSASIYFDYNAPVITNPAVTSIVSPQTCFTMSTTSVDAFCAQAIGSITVTVSGGTAPYSFAINNGAFQSSPDFAGLLAGTYSVKVSDATGCIDSVSTVVGSMGSITATVSSTPASCAGVNNATITVMPVSGTAPYSYSLNGGATQTNETFTGVSAGSHTILVSDALGCTATIVTFVNSGSGITVGATATPDGCTGSGSGSITTTVSGGTSPYTYSINSGPLQGSPDFTGLAAGVYSVKAVDANGCMDSLSVTVAPSAGISATASSTPASCAGVNNGTIIVTPGGGTAPYNYVLDGGASQTSETFTGVGAGVHTVVVTDALGCTVSVTVTISSGTGITASAATTPSNCGVQNGSITITPAGGTNPYTYSLDGGAAQSSETFSSVPSGTHTVTAQDATGCTVSLTVVVDETPISATVVVTQPTCTTQGMIDISGPTGTAPFQYSINGGALQSAPLFNGITAGTYVVLVQDANLCTYSETVVINGAPASVTPGVSITGSATSICAGEPVTFTATSTNGGANPQYQWTVNGANAGTNSATLTINPATNADVSVQLTSDDPCASPTTASSNVVSVTVNPSQSPAITIAGNTSVDQGASSNITSSIVNGGTSPFYQWQDSTASHTWADIAGATNSSIDYSPQQTGDGLRAILTSTAGCTSSSTATSNALYFIVNTTSTPRTVLYPNPVHSILTIESTNAVQWAVADILDDNGRRIFTYANSSANSEVRMDVSRLPAGIYFVRLIDRTGKPEYFKFVKQ